MGRRWIGALATVAMLLGAWPTAASGPGRVTSWYLDRYGGEAADLNALYEGRLGVVMTSTPRPQLYLAWRLLHGQAVGSVAGRALSEPCCGTPAWVFYDETRPSGPRVWLAARRRVQGAQPKAYAPTGDEQPYFMWSDKCFDDAFRNAADTLAARIGAHGAASPWVRAWLDVQDAVFANCRESTAVPSLPGGAPGWLKSDYAYQSAAAALYDGRTEDALAGFGAVGADGASPWRPLAPYLRARTLRRAALSQPTAANFVRARTAIADLAMRPAGTFGRDEVTPMLRSLAFRDQPKALLAELTADLSRDRPTPRIAADFRDLAALHDKGAGPAEVVDWIATMRPQVADAAASAIDWQDEAMARLRHEARRDARAHARARWAATRDPAWLIAVLSLAGPSEVGDLASAAAGVAASDPAWLSIQYHLARLSLTSTPETASRAKLDAILRRADLSATDRNLFTALRLQVSSDARDFARFALRRRVCADAWPSPDKPKLGCVGWTWTSDSIQPRGVYDGVGADGRVGFGEDARAVIDRLPLAERIALSRDATLPAALRLDLALTSYARAVLLQDAASADALAADLTTLLPQMAADWRRIRATAPGPAKQFARYMILAKIPGLRTDLADYTRPEGTVAQFQRTWIPWTLLPKGRAVLPAPPPQADYQRLGYGAEPTLSEGEADLTCLGLCGAGPTPLRLPDFAAAGQAKAVAERGYFLRPDSRYVWDEKPAVMPAGGISVWDEMLAYARAHPSNPQVPEALYWINRAGRWGGTWNRSGRRAFVLLHARYPASTWAKRSPYTYD